MQREKWRKKDGLLRNPRQKLEENGKTYEGERIFLQRRRRGFTKEQRTHVAALNGTQNFIKVVDYLAT